MRKPGFSPVACGYSGAMRVGRNVEVRPLGGAPGCLAMIIGSVVVSVLLTLILNLAVR